MRFTEIKILIIVLFLSSHQNIFCQEPVFTQFQNNPIYLNPALAGQYKFRLCNVLNSQWFNVPGQFNTQFISIDGKAERKGNKYRIQSLPSLKDGFLLWGCSFLRNSEGEFSLNTNNVSFILGYGKEIKTNSKSLLTFSIPLQFSLINKNIDFSNAVFMQNLDPVFGNINSNNFVSPTPSYNYPTFSTGVNFSYINNLIKSKADYKLNFGGAVSNILLNELEGFILQNTVDNKKWTFYGTLFLKKSLFFRNSIFYQKQNVFETFQITSDLKVDMLENFTFGLLYRHQLVNSSQNKIALESFHIAPTFFLNQKSDYPIRISLSYGFTLSDLNQSNTKGIAEISMQIIFDQNNQWEFCPGDKGYRADLNSKNKEIEKINKKRAKKRN